MAQVILTFLCFNDIGLPTWSIRDPQFEKNIIIYVSNPIRQTEQGPNKVKQKGHCNHKTEHNTAKHNL